MRILTQRPQDGPQRKTLRVVLVLSLLVLGTLGVGMSRRSRHSGALQTANASGLNGGAALGPGVATQRLNVVALVQVAAPIRADARLPHPPRGPCQNCHQILRVAQNHMLPMAATTVLGSAPKVQSGPALPARKRPFHEAHWQGIEVIALTAPLALDLGLAPEDRGVVIDQASFPADGQGFAAGDLVVSVGGVATPHLANFVAATDAVRDQRKTTIQVIRNGQPAGLVLAAKRLGVANGETPPIIPPDAVPPRGCAQAHAALMHLDTLGPCTDCHIVRAQNPLPLDLADVLPKPALTPIAPPDPLCLPPGF